MERSKELLQIKQQIKEYLSDIVINRFVGLKFNKYPKLCDLLNRYQELNPEGSSDSGIGFIPYISGRGTVGLKIIENDFSSRTISLSNSKNTETIVTYAFIVSNLARKVDIDIIATISYDNRINHIDHKYPLSAVIKVCLKELQLLEGKITFNSKGNALRKFSSKKDGCYPMNNSVVRGKYGPRLNPLLEKLLFHVLNRPGMHQVMNVSENIKKGDKISSKELSSLKKIVHNDYLKYII